jgi:hypothetical protein
MPRFVWRRSTVPGRRACHQRRLLFVRSLCIRRFFHGTLAGRGATVARGCRCDRTARHGRRPPRGAISSMPAGTAPFGVRLRRRGVATLGIGCAGTPRATARSRVRARSKRSTGFRPPPRRCAPSRVSVAVDPRATHPESASDIAHADESVRAQPQLVCDAVSNRLDVLLVEHHDPAPPAVAQALRPK